jgi:nitrite reductase/ring-hydroxylating ferredoxin subunit
VTEETQHGGETTRRAALAGAGIAGAALLAACSSSSSSTDASGSMSSSTAAAGTGASSAAAPASSAAAGGQALGAASDIPVGGGKVFSSAKVVVTQPTAGTYKGFSAVCTHEQCIVDQVSNGTIDCPCHGSQFSVKDGSVVAGPAPSPLPSAPVNVSGGQITLG